MINLMIRKKIVFVPSCMLFVALLVVLYSCVSGFVMFLFWLYGKKLSIAKDILL